MHVPSDLRLDKLGPDLDRIASYLFLDEYFCSAGGQSQLARALGNQSFDVCIVEQPFMGRAMLQFFQADDRQMPIFVYSSQNIESPMISGILRESQVIPEQQINHWTREILDLESNFAQQADWCLAVCESDGKSLERLGARGWTLVPNGADIQVASRGMLRKVDRLIGDRKFLLFVASGHPPNLEGFLQMIGTDGTFLPPDALIVVAGSVSWPINSELGSNETESLSSRLILLGEVSDDALAALIVRATGILIPVVSGGGSNLKTAEALVSGKEIVATEFAFRGFEQFVSLPRVHMSKHPSEFRRNMVSLLKRGVSEQGCSGSPTEEPSMPTWQNCLSPLPGLLSDLKAGRK